MAPDQPDDLDQLVLAACNEAEIEGTADQMRTETAEGASMREACRQVGCGPARKAI